jgi:hypothetical protein
MYMRVANNVLEIQWRKRRKVWEPLEAELTCERLNPPKISHDILEYALLHHDIVSGSMLTNQFCNFGSVEFVLVHTRAFNKNKFSCMRMRVVLDD